MSAHTHTHCFWKSIWFVFCVLLNHRSATYAKIDAMYNPYWGQLFRSGTKHSYFSLMVERFADLYTSSFETLTNYPITYPFLSTAEKLPHEEGP